MVEEWIGFYVSISGRDVGSVVIVGGECDVLALVCVPGVQGLAQGGVWGLSLETLLLMWTMVARQVFGWW